MDFRPIFTERLILRRFAPSDLESFLQYRQDPEVARYQGWSQFTREQAVAFVTDMAVAPADVPGTWMQIAIEVRATGEMAGDCAVHTREDDSTQVEIGYTLDRKHQGKGYAHEAIHALLEYLFKTLNKRRITAITDARNEASIRLLESLGMRREGHFVENLWFKGEWGSEYQYAMLKREWDRLQSG